ncbi:LLM class flavin-dependent oxidoreductase [Symbioplanes lichenis]|uniref:LLM class flavin-dependent oxidoreductase n=1 Tax=Symbioplanes lichenis TaxID=1629072 RepID=UPI0027386160|nr:LLM class flavin-dependent oxidoreductase [Actinoplanes lichenis]
MAIEFIGYTESADWRRDPAAVIDLGHIREMAVFQEQLGFDSILVGYGPESPDPVQIAAYAAARTDRIRMLVAHRPGIVFPTLAARTFATLDHITGGRVSVNLVCGGAREGDARREGDYSEKDERYARAAEYIEVLTAAWTAEEPFSHAGTYYRFEDFAPRVRPLQQPRIPLYLAGSSEAARTVAARHADHHAFFGEPLAGCAEMVSSVRRTARDAGRAGAPGFVVRLSVILGDTDDAARERAEALLARSGGESDSVPQPDFTAGENRLRAAHARGRHHDRAMWTARAASWGATLGALVGSPRTVAEAILDYVRLGITGFRINGLDPALDTEVFGKRVIPLVRSATGSGPSPDC